MLRIVDTLKIESARALSRGALVLVGSTLIWAAAVFVAAAVAVLLSGLMPTYAAVLCGAGVLAAAGLLCLLAGSRPERPHRALALREAPASEQYQLSDVAYRLLEDELRARPGKAAAAAVVAGFIIGALDALEKRRKPERRNESELS